MSEAGNGGKNGSLEVWRWLLATAAAVVMVLATAGVRSIMARVDLIETRQVDVLQRLTRLEAAVEAERRR